ncbi:hypothetical protein [Mariniluteicoccus flavus]
MTTGRITFADNPWPLGHAIESLTMTLRGGDDDEVRLHLDVRSEPFDANGPGRPVTHAAPGAWDDPATWVAQPGAIISSTKWHNAGVPVKVDDELAFDEVDLTGTWRADPASSFDANGVMEERAFGAFILGAAAVADHEITLDRTGPNLFDLRWTGRLARTWSGDTQLAQRFTVEAHDVRLS